MISRSRCKEIARVWQRDKGMEEFERRMHDIRNPEPFLGQLPSGKTLTELRDRAVEFCLQGGYDPPFPEIPGFFQRLFMSDWTPPEVGYPEWRMCSKDYQARKAARSER